MKTTFLKSKIEKFVEIFFNLNIIPIWRMEKYALAQHLNELFDHFKIKTVFDVGANIGQYANFLRNEVKFNGTILSFEPGKELFNILQEAAEKDADWHCFPLALGEENRIDNINIMARSQFNSLLNPKNDLLFKKENSVIDSYQIEVSTLDKFWLELMKEYDLSSVYLKLDTQGYDLRILKGSKNILSKVKALQSEMSIIQIYQDMPDYKEVIHFLESNNFALSAMHPITHDPNMKLIEFDGVFVNSDYCDS